MCSNIFLMEYVFKSLHFQTHLACLIFPIRNTLDEKAAFKTQMLPCPYTCKRETGRDQVGRIDNVMQLKYIVLIYLPDFYSVRGN